MDSMTRTIHTYCEPFTEVYLRHSLYGAAESSCKRRLSNVLGAIQFERHNKNFHHNSLRFVYLLWNQLIHGTEARNSTTAGEVSRFQCLFPNPNWLVWKGIPSPKTRSNLPWDRQLPYDDKIGFSQNGSVTMTEREVPKCC